LTHGDFGVIGGAERASSRPNRSIFEATQVTGYPEVQLPTVP
jgi:hypothetical protein